MTKSVDGVQYSFLSLFLAGLLGERPIVPPCAVAWSALSMPGRGAASLGQQLLFNLGRIGSYMLVGAIAGTIGNSTQIQHKPKRCNWLCTAFPA